MSTAVEADVPQPPERSPRARGTASAASNAVYVNDLVRTYESGDSGSNWNGCNRGKCVENVDLDRTLPRDPQEYYDCAPGYFGNGVQQVNL